MKYFLSLHFKQYIHNFKKLMIRKIIFNPIRVFKIPLLFQLFIYMILLIHDNLLQ